MPPVAIGASAAARQSLLITTETSCLSSLAFNTYPAASIQTSVGPLPPTAVNGVLSKPTGSLGGYQSPFFPVRHAVVADDPRFVGAGGPDIHRALDVGCPADPAVAVPVQDAVGAAQDPDVVGAGARDRAHLGPGRSARRRIFRAPRGAVPVMNQRVAAEHPDIIGARAQTS